METKKRKKSPQRLDRQAIVVVFALLLMISLLQSRLYFAAEPLTYTLDDLIAAYEAGQFRVIHTRDTHPLTNINGTHFLTGNGLYRVSDGAYSLEFDNAYPFSPDGEHFVALREGIYRVSDMQRIIPVPSERIVVANGDHAIQTGEVVFSDDGKYAGIEGAGHYRDEAELHSNEGYGIFRLSDGQQIITSDSLFIEFSPNSEYVSTQEGVFRLSDGEQLVHTDKHISPIFSPDSQYSYDYENGITHLSDQQRVFPPTDGWLVFSPDMQFIVIPETGVFRTRDWQLQFELNYDSVYLKPPRFSSDHKHLIIPFSKTYEEHSSGAAVYRVEDGAHLMDLTNGELSPDGKFVADSLDGIYRLVDSEKIFDFGEYSWTPIFSSNTAYVHLPDGIYRVLDQQRIIVLDGVYDHSVTFSPDEQYAAVNNRAVYRLADGEKLFDIQGNVRHFTDDSQYISIGFKERHLHRIRDGRLFEGLDVVHIEAGIMAVGNTVLVVDPTQDNQQVMMLRTSPDLREPLYEEPNTESERIWRIDEGSHLAILEQKEG